MRLTSLTAAFAFAAALPIAAEAMPLAQAIPLAGIDAPAITLTSGGCGFRFHRGPFGGCRPNFGGYGYGYGRPYGFRGYGWHRWHRW